MNERPTEDHQVLVSGVEDGIAWCVCAAPLPAANGYVRIPDDHPWSRLNEDDVPLDAPGGITWGRNGWFGFDTLHAGDVWSDEEIARLEELGAEWRSNYRVNEHLNSWSTNWSIELITEETKRLARQVAAYQGDLEKTIESIKSAGETP